MCGGRASTGHLTFGWDGQKDAAPAAKGGDRPLSGSDAGRRDQCQDPERPPHLRPGQHFALSRGLNGHPCSVWARASRALSLLLFFHIRSSTAHRTRGVFIRPLTVLSPAGAGRPAPLLSPKRCTALKGQFNRSRGPGTARLWLNTGPPGRRSPNAVAEIYICMTRIRMPCHTNSPPAALGQRICTPSLCNGVHTNTCCSRSPLGHQRTTSGLSWSERFWASTSSTLRGKNGRTGFTDHFSVLQPNWHWISCNGFSRDLEFHCGSVQSSDVKGVGSTVLGTRANQEVGDLG